MEETWREAFAAICQASFTLLSKSSSSSRSLGSTLERWGTIQRGKMGAKRRSFTKKKWVNEEQRVKEMRLMTASKGYGEGPTRKPER